MKNFFDLSHKSTFVQGVAFYFVVLFIIIAAGILASGIESVISNAKNYEESYKIGWVAGHTCAILACTVLAAVIVTKKSLWKSCAGVVTFALAFLFSIVGGALLGVFPVAVLYCMKPKYIKNSQD